jgi:hypothetical protein
MLENGNQYGIPTPHSQLPLSYKMSTLVYPSQLVLSNYNKMLGRHSLGPRIISSREYQESLSILLRQRHTGTRTKKL